MNLKEELLYQCTVFLNNRFKTISDVIENLKKALNSETKSTAGDKHETGRAMLQLELEKSGKQFQELQKQQAVLKKVNLKSNHRAALGSLIYTTNQNYFIAISAGKINIHNTDFYAISPSTPIAKQLISKKQGDEITFRNRIFVITKIE